MANKVSSSSKLSSVFAAIVIPATIVVAVLLFFFVLGSPSNFEGGDVEKGHPLNTLGTVYKGGMIVPILMSFFMMVLIFSIERFITIKKAYGKGSLDKFVIKIKSLLEAKDLDAAFNECDKQKGAVGNVVYSVLSKYEHLVTEPGMNKDQKVVALQKELEEATSLELPMLEKNLTIIATLASIATLVGLIGTVLGMIKSFSGMAADGGGDSAVIALGISEALINTALGITTSTLSIIAYNYFTSEIDTLTYSIDESGYSITQNFSATQS
ncbi:MAG: MotA/TolQ/ExbB proton channel family protein [Cytophagales bacterium]|nr:MAG: MotA/TolQ/ExbB proton channel family protein [Cytophagales bacterium]